MSADKHPAEVLADRRRIEGPLASWQREAEVMLRRIPALEAERDQLRADLAAFEKALYELRSDAEKGARNLRAEVEALRDDCENARHLARLVCDALNVPILHDAPAAIEALRADAERIDWLADPDNTIGNVQLPRECVEQNLHSLRDAIDAARKHQ